MRSPATLAASLALAALLAAPAAAQEATFRGLAWGASAADAERALLAAGYRGVGRTARGEPFLERGDEFVQTVVGPAGLVRVTRTWEGNERATGRRFATLADSLTRAIGRPADTLHAHHAAWVLPSGAVSVSHLTLPDGELRVVMVHRAPATAPARAARRANVGRGAVLRTRR